MSVIGDICKNTLDIWHEISNSLLYIGVINIRQYDGYELNYDLSTFTMKLIIDKVITNVDAPDDPFFLYSAEPHVTPQYISQIKSTTQVATNR